MAGNTLSKIRATSTTEVVNKSFLDVYITLGFF